MQADAKLTVQLPSTLVLQRESPQPPVAPVAPDPPWPAQSQQPPPGLGFDAGSGFGSPAL